MNRPTIVLAAVCLVLVTTATVDAARLPDWASAIAELPLTEEGHDSSETFQVLLSERTMTFQPDGRVIVEDRIAKRALRGASDDVGAGAIALGSNWLLKKSRAWHQPPGERAKKSRRSSSFELNDTSIFLSDNRVRGVAIPDIVEGSLIFFEFRAEWTPYTLSFNHAFREQASVVVSRLVVEVPNGWTVDFDWIGTIGPEASTEGSARVWQVENLAYLKPEPLTGNALDDSLVLAVAVMPPDGVHPETAVSFQSWNDLSEWLTQLIDDRASVSVESTVGWSGDRERNENALIQIESTSRAVRDSVRYVAKEVGIGGYQPRHATETATTLWGDCKDKSILLQAVLANQGVTAFPVLVNASSDNTVSERIPTLDAFNHMITAVALGEQAIPAHLAHAVVESETHGSLLIIDTTDEYTSPGSIPGAILGHRGLVMDGSSGTLVTLPGSNSEDHRLEQMLTVRVLGDGTVSFSRVRELFGQPAASYRAGRRMAQTSWRDRIEGQVRDQWIGANVDAFEVKDETADGRTVERISWTIESLPGGSGEHILTLFAQAVNALPRVTLRRRQHPVVYGYPRVIRSAIQIEGLPEGFTTPKARTTTGNGWQLKTTFDNSQSEFTATFEMILNASRFDKEAFADLRKLYSSLAVLRKAAVVVPRG